MIKILMFIVLSLLSVPSFASVNVKSDGVLLGPANDINFTGGSVYGKGDVKTINLNYFPSNVGIGTTQALAPLDVYRTSAWTYTTDAAVRSSWIYDIGSTDVAASIYGYSKNTGSNAASGGHIIGVLGIGEDNAANNLPVYGTEGRVNWHTASTVTSAGLIGVAHWYDLTVGNATVFSAGSVNAGLITLAEILNNDESTPRAEGVNAGIFVNSNTGGLFNYGIKVNTQTSGTFDFGVAIGKADTRTLQVNDTTDSTDATGGIFFGQSADTNLYRSAVSTISSDGTLMAAQAIKVGTGTPTGAFTVTSQDTIGWTVKNVANQACSTTCTTACVFGMNTGALGNFTGCGDATSDTCICAGAN